MRVSSGSGASSPSLTSWSIAARNAANVLPDPVGAATNTCSPDIKAGHARSCAGVGASKVRKNHAATAGWNESRALMAQDQQGVSVSIRGARQLRRTPHRQGSFRFDDFLQIVQTALVNSADRIHSGLVVLIFGRILADVLTLEVAGPRDRGLVLAGGLDGQSRRVVADWNHALDDGVLEGAARRIEREQLFFDRPAALQGQQAHGPDGIVLALDDFVRGHTRMPGVETIEILDRVPNFARRRVDVDRLGRGEPGGGRLSVGARQQGESSDYCSINFHCHESL